jgi:predicted amidohydrolase
MRIAVAQYHLDSLPNWEAYQTKIQAWVKDAVEQQAQLLVFSEYGTLELFSLPDFNTSTDLVQRLVILQKYFAPLVQFYQQLAQDYQVYILAPSLPVQLPNQGYHNRAYLFFPEGSLDFQDKLILTPSENETGIIGGSAIKIFDTAVGKLAITICYDSEFPLLVRQAVEMGATLILVPSCTHSLAGYYRVRTGCQARALENQCYVVQAPTLGVMVWHELEECIGAAGIYTPIDQGFPSDGLLQKGPLNISQWIYANLALEELAVVRQAGQVRNYFDWNKQYLLSSLPLP